MNSKLNQIYQSIEDIRKALGDEAECVPIDELAGMISKLTNDPTRSGFTTTFMFSNDENPNIPQETRLNVNTGLVEDSSGGSQTGFESATYAIRSQSNNTNWITFAIFGPDGSQKTEGSTPKNLKGERGERGTDGKPGQNGNVIKRLYIALPDLMDVPAPRNYNPDKDSDLPGFNGKSWTTVPSGVSIAYQVEYETVSEKENGVGSEGSVPSIYARGSKDGKDGIGRSIFIYTSTSTIDSPKTPQGGSGDPETNTITVPEGWFDNVPESRETYLGLSNAFFANDGITIKSWSTPVRLTGEDGQDGVDGKDIEFIYRLLPNRDTYSALRKYISDNPLTSGNDLEVPAVNDNLGIDSVGTNNPSGIDGSNYLIEVVCSRTKKDDVWSDGSLPTYWSMWGEDGMDGAGVEYIFRITSEEFTSDMLLAEFEQHDIYNHPDYQKDNFYPGGNGSVELDGTDEPSDVSETEPIEGVCIRRKIDGIWGEFSEPKVWGKYAKDGYAFKTSYVFTRAISQPARPYGGTYNEPYPTILGADGVTTQKDPVWSDTVPAGLGEIYMTYRTFYSGPEIVDEDWSTPVKMTDTAGFQVEYSTRTEKPAIGSLQPYYENYINGVDTREYEIVWREDNTAWSDDGTDAVGMATSVLKGGKWTDGSVVKIKGENGDAGKDGTSIKIKGIAIEVFDTLPDTLLIDEAGNEIHYVLFKDWIYKFNPETDTYEKFIAEEIGDGFVVNRNFGIWDGYKGYNVGEIKGVDGESAGFIVKFSDDKIEFTADNGTEPGRYIGMLFGVGAMDENYVNTASNYDGTLWSGDDGWGGEQIFLLTSKDSGYNEDNPPAIPTDNTKVLDHVPEGWTDTPSSVSTNFPYCWSAKRKASRSEIEDGKGNPEKPGYASLYTRYAYDGITAFHLELTNDQIVVPVEKDGSIDSDFTEASTRMILYSGDTVVESTDENPILYTVSAGTVSDGDVTLTGEDLKDIFEVTCKATYNGTDFYKTLHVIKTDTAYDITVNRAVLTRGEDGYFINGDKELIVNISRWNADHGYGIDNQSFNVSITHLDSTVNTDESYITVNGKATITLSDEKDVRSIKIYFIKNGIEYFEEVGVIADGKQGPVGPEGPEGPQGPQGSDGVAGIDGKSVFSVSLSDDVFQLKSVHGIVEDDIYPNTSFEGYYGTQPCEIELIKVIIENQEILCTIDNESHSIYIDQTSDVLANGYKDGNSVTLPVYLTFLVSSDGVSAEKVIKGTLRKVATKISLFVTPNVIKDVDDNKEIEIYVEYDNKRYVPKQLDGIKIYVNGVEFNENVYTATNTVNIELKSVDGELLDSEIIPGLFDGKDGVSIVWKGDSTEHLENPENGWAYHNTSDKASYVFFDQGYLMSKDGQNGLDGKDGKDGTSISIKDSLNAESELPTPPANASDCYIIGLDLYVWTGSTWKNVGQFKGDKGEGFVYIGEGSSWEEVHIKYGVDENPHNGWCYRDTDNGRIYVGDGDNWEIMVEDGQPGANGSNGLDGLSVFVTYNDNSIDSEPSNPTGDGNGNGGHTNATLNVNGMSQKVAATATEGEWGDPILICGRDGADGKAGADGKGIVSTTVEYGISTSENEKPTTGTSTTPTLEGGKYLGTKTTGTYTEGYPEVGYSVNYIPKDGQDGNSGKDGAPGKDGVSIVSTKCEYAVSDNQFTTPSSGSETTPTLVGGNYLGTRTTGTYSEGDPEYGFSVNYIPKDGEKGLDGKDGAVGAEGRGIKDTKVEYAISTSQSTIPTSGWSTSTPTLTNGSYLWTRTTWTYTSGDPEVGYQKTYIPLDGPKGDDGEAGAPGVGIASTKVEYAISDSGTIKPTTGSETTPVLEGGKYLGTKTTWTYTEGPDESGYSVTYIGKDGEKGDQGDTGPQGPQGPEGVAGSSGPVIYPEGKGESGKIYTGTSKKAPYVTYNDSYYIALGTVNVEPIGSNIVDINDIDGSDPINKWVKMDQFAAIYTDIVFADFAKLGSGVFSGDYMFSQNGINGSYDSFDATTGNTNSYTGFVPNIVMNAKTGSVSMCGKNVNFNADGTGNIGRVLIGDENGITSNKYNIELDYDNPENQNDGIASGTFESNAKLDDKSILILKGQSDTYNGGSLDIYPPYQEFTGDFIHHELTVINTMDNDVKVHGESKSGYNETILRAGRIISFKCIFINNLLYYFLENNN